MNSQKCKASVCMMLVVGLAVGIEASNRPVIEVDALSQFAAVDAARGHRVT
jgi:hypothetical protein